MVKDMSTNSSGKRDDVYVMPETFSFGLEEREDKDAENASADSRGADSESSCIHRWKELPKEKQTLASESKTIWKCRTCGDMTNTYSWKKP